MAKETNGGTWVDVNSNEEKGHINIYDNDPRGEHNSIHINIDYDKKDVKIVEKENGEKTTTDTNCCITNACIIHYKEKFNDNSDELNLIRWFRDNFVLKEDVIHYYNISPRIVWAIDRTENSDIIYEYIYKNIVDFCCKAIKQKKYDLAYSEYKKIMNYLEKQLLNEQKNIFIRKMSHFN